MNRPADAVHEPVPAWARALPGPWRARLLGSGTLRRVVPNIGWLLADRALRMALSLVVGTWIARYLGPDQFGLLSYALSFAALFAPLATLGLERVVVRELVSTPEHAPEILGTALGLRLAGGVVAALLAVVAILRVRPDDPLALALVAITAGAMVAQAFEVIDLWFQARVRSRDVVLARAVAFGLASAIKVALIVTRAPLIAFAWAWAAEFALGALGLLWVYAVRAGAVRAWRLRAARAMPLLRDGWPLAVSSVMVMLYMRIDQVMLGQMAPAAELGAYAAAVKLVEAWYFLPTLVVASLFPSIVEARATSEAQFHGRLQKLYGLMALLAYAVAVPTTLLAGPIVRVLYGAAYARAAPMLAVLVWSLLFTNLGVARGSYLVAMNWGRAYIITVAAGALVNVLLNLWLIPRLGGMGAVIASLVAYWLAAHGACYLYPPLVRTGNMLAKAMVMPGRWS